jgi:hypothetical protein
MVFRHELACLRAVGVLLRIIYAVNAEAKLVWNWKSKFRYNIYGVIFIISINVKFFFNMLFVILKTIKVKCRIE